MYSVPDLDPDSGVYDNLLSYPDIIRVRVPQASVSDPDNMPVRVPHKVVYHTQLDDDDDNSEQLKVFF